MFNLSDTPRYVSPPIPPVYPGYPVIFTHTTDVANRTLNVQGTAEVNGQIITRTGRLSYQNQVEGALLTQLREMQATLQQQILDQVPTLFPTERNGVPVPPIWDNPPPDGTFIHEYEPRVQTQSSSGNFTTRRNRSLAIRKIRNQAMLFHSNWRENEIYTGRVFSWNRSGGIETGEVFNKVVYTRYSNKIILDSPKSLDGIPINSIFSNRVRLFWRHLGIPAVRYKNKTKITWLGEPHFISPGETLTLRRP